MKKILLALLAFISFSCPAFAADWNYVGKNRDGESIYLDKDSIIKIYGNIGGWLKLVGQDGNIALCDVSVRPLDRTMAIVSVVICNKSGKVKDQYTYSYPEYDPIVPDSIMEIIYNSLMENKESNLMKKREMDLKDPSYRGRIFFGKINQADFKRYLMSVEGILS